MEHIAACGASSEPPQSTWPTLQVIPAPTTVTDQGLQKNRQLADIFRSELREHSVGADLLPLTRHMRPRALIRPRATRGVRLPTGLLRRRRQPPRRWSSLQLLLRSRPNRCRCITLLRHGAEPNSHRGCACLLGRTLPRVRLAAAVSFDREGLPLLRCNNANRHRMSRPNNVSTHRERDSSGGPVADPRRGAQPTVRASPCGRAMSGRGPPRTADAGTVSAAAVALFPWLV